MIVLDLSRLLSRAGIATPTGIDRVELAYARHALASERPHCFAAINAAGAIGVLPQTDAAQFVTGLGAIWSDGATPGRTREVKALGRHLHRVALFGGASALRARLQGDDRHIYLLVSHHHLDRARPIARLKQATGARFVCLIHDLIPLELPQYTRAEQTVRHRRRLETVAVLAEAVIANSAATRTTLLHHLERGERDTPITVAPLGLDLTIDSKPTNPAEPPYFVCIGTLEARKNHAMLLDVWRRLAAERGERTPRLMLIGRRGWGSDRLADRLAALNPIVIEQPDLPDVAMTPLLRGARGLLLPSFAEGFGLPVIEALAHGVPVLCSDLPALRESGDGVPDYLDPADPVAWHAAIIDYLADPPRRRAQLARLASWRAPRWDEHFAIVDQLLGDLEPTA
jgi:glycosyltransferase involved in cell wall biosynthesis